MKKFEFEFEWPEDLLISEDAKEFIDSILV